MGPPASFKTTLMLQFPDIHVLDCDRNLDGPIAFIKKNLLPNFSFTFDPIRYTEDGKPVPIEDCYNRIVDILKRFKSVLEYQARKAVGLDSLSHVNEFLIRHVLRLQDKSKRAGEMEARDWSPFKSYAYQLLLGALEETGKTVICVCHEQKIYGKADKDNMMNPPVEAYEPMFQGKIGETLGGYFTDVWRMEVRPAPQGRVESILQTMPTTRVAMLKNTVGMPAELNVTAGFKVIEPYIKHRLL